MKSDRPVSPLVREVADVRPRQSLLEGQANTDIFGGWGVRFGLKVW